MKKLTQEEVFSIFEDYGCRLISSYASCSVPLEYQCKCGRLGNISLDKFKRRIKRKEGCKYCLHHEWTKEQDEILRNMYGKEPRSIISKALGGITLASIKSRAQYLDLQGDCSVVNIKARKGKGRKYSFNEDFFSKKSLISCYWAGYLAAVGNISPQKNTVYIKLNQQDKKHLQQFQDDSCHTGLIHELDEKIILLQFHSAEKWIKDLSKNFSITAKKHLNLKPPIDLSEKEALSYIIGYFDGNGDLNDNKQKYDYGMQIKGNQFILLWIKSWFDIWYPPLNKKILDIKKYKKSLFKYFLLGVRAKYIIEKLMSINLPRLSRKWDQYKNKQGTH